MPIGRHRGGSAAEERAQVQEIIQDLERQKQGLHSVKYEVRLAGSKILMLHSRDPGVMIAGGALINNLPLCIDELVNGIDLHIRVLETFMRDIL